MKNETTNTGNADTLDPMEDVVNYAAGTEDGMGEDPKEKGQTDDDDEDDDDIELDDDINDDDYSEDEPLPGEIANPEELDDEEVV